LVHNQAKTARTFDLLSINSKLGFFGSITIEVEHIFTRYVIQLIVSM